MSYSKTGPRILAAIMGEEIERQCAPHHSALVQLAGRYLIIQSTIAHRQEGILSGVSTLETDR